MFLTWKGLWLFYLKDGHERKQSFHNRNNVTVDMKHTENSV